MSDLTARCSSQLVTVTIGKSCMAGHASELRPMPSLVMTAEGVTYVVVGADKTRKQGLADAIDKIIY